MTRKDYVLIADAVRTARSKAIEGHTPDELVYLTVAQVAMALKQDNPRFDRNRFMTATGLENAS